MNGSELGRLIESELLKARVVFLTGEINDEVATDIINKLFYLESSDPQAIVYLHINSPGGVITDGLAIYDIIQSLSCPVATVCIGQAASMGAILLASGTKGMRMSFPNARMMIHQPMGGARGQAADIEIQAKEMLLLRQRLNEILSAHTGQPLEVIEQDTDRDFFLDVEGAVQYGLIDRIIRKGEGVIHR